MDRAYPLSVRSKDNNPAIISVGSASRSEDLPGRLWVRVRGRRRWGEGGGGEGSKGKGGVRRVSMGRGGKGGGWGGNGGLRGRGRRRKKDAGRAQGEGKREGQETAVEVEGVKPRYNSLKNDVPFEAAKGATLWETVGRGEGGGKEPIDADNRGAPCHEDLHPANNAPRVKAQTGRHLEKEGPICGVIRLGEI